MVDYTERALNTWQDGETRDIHREVAMISHAMDVIMDRIQQEQGGLQLPLWLPGRACPTGSCATS